MSHFGEIYNFVMHSLIQNSKPSFVLVIEKFKHFLAHRLVWDLDFRKEFPNLTPCKGLGFNFPT